MSPIIVPPTGEVQTLVDRIVAASGDVTEADALARLNTAHKRMVARSEINQDKVALGPLVNGQAFYPVDTTVIIKPMFLTVDGAPYGDATRPDVYAYSNGGLVWTGATGLAVYGPDATRRLGVTLIPTPDASGGDLELIAVCHAPTMVAADTPLVDPDMYDDLVDYAIALGRERDDERMDAGAAFRQHFDAACEELRRRVRRRSFGAGTLQARIIGINA